MNNTSTAYASARLDGVLDYMTLKIGLLTKTPQPTPVIAFYVLAGLQRHPIWALDRMAAVVFCYCVTAKQVDQPMEVSVTANLVSGSETICAIASNISWHTSKEIRNKAENMIARMTGSGARWAEQQWPFRDVLQMPINLKPREQP
jgi:hypothetical protein